MKRPITRKEFLAATAKSVAAASVGAASVTLLAGGRGQIGRVGPITGQAAVHSWPWPYAKLDTEDVRKRAHKNYYDGGCCYGAFNGLVSALAEVVGEPFTLMPTQLTYFGGGGGAGWGTLCGALNGSAMLVNLVVDRTSANTIVGELFGWYTVVTFPSDVSNDYAERHQFLVNRNDKILLQTVSDSPLCHVSVSSWCTHSGYRAAAAERAERCARLTGDVAAKTVEMLNQFKDGTFRATFVAASSVTGCQSCHDIGIGNVQSGVKMDCNQCHRQKWDHLY